MTTDTMFRTGNAINGRHGIKARETHSKPRIAIKVEAGAQVHSVIYGRYDDGRIAEVFIDGFDDTSARLATLLLQRGVEIETVRRTIDNADLLAIILDRLINLSGGPRTAAYRWLSKCSRRRSVNRIRTTYGFKHWAEQDEGEYVSVESFHEAAIALGFRLEFITGTPHAWINISEPSKQTKKREHRQ